MKNKILSLILPFFLYSSISNSMDLYSPYSSRSFEAEYQKYHLKLIAKEFNEEYSITDLDKKLICNYLTYKYIPLKAFDSKEMEKTKAEFDEKNKDNSFSEAWNCLENTIKILIYDKGFDLWITIMEMTTNIINKK